MNTFFQCVTYLLMNPNFFGLALVPHLLPENKDQARIPEPAFKPFDLSYLCKAPEGADRQNAVVRLGAPREDSELLAA